MNQEKYFSWTIINENTAHKLCDKSVYKYHSSGIPAQVKSFFQIEDLQYGEKYDILLQKDNITYHAYCKLDNNLRAKIYWKQDFAEQLQKYNNSLSLIMEFTRIAKDTYRISFIEQNENATSTREIQENLDLETYVIETQNTGNLEGKRYAMYVTKYERDQKNRAEAIRIHGTTCQVCNFNFEAFYGEQGKNYIEVHHIKPLYSLEEEIEVNPATDLVCICSNCHRMIHRSREKILLVEELKQMIRSNNPK